MKNTDKPVTKRPIKVAGYSHAKADARKAKRQSEADARQAKYDAMNPIDRAAHDARLKREFEAGVAKILMS